PTAALTPVAVTIQPIDCSQSRGAQLLEEFGPSLLASVRNYLQAHDERRELRYPFARPVQVSRLVDGQVLGSPIDAVGKDISLAGMGLYLTCRPPSRDLAVHLVRSPGAP